jgi:hypothetical protein
VKSSGRASDLRLQGCRYDTEIMPPPRPAVRVPRVSAGLLASLLLGLLLAGCGQPSAANLPAGDLFPPHTIFVTRIGVGPGRGHEIRLAQESAPDPFSHSVEYPVRLLETWPRECDTLASLGVEQLLLATSPFGTVILMEGPDGIDTAELSRAIEGTAPGVPVEALGHGWYRTPTPAVGPTPDPDHRLLERMFLEAAAIDPDSAVMTITAFPEESEPSGREASMLGEAFGSCRMYVVSLGREPGAVTTGLRFNSGSDAERYAAGQGDPVAMELRTMMNMKFLGSKPLEVRGAWCMGGVPGRGMPSAAAAATAAPFPFAAHGGAAVHLRIDDDAARLTPAELAEMSTCLRVHGHYAMGVAFLGQGDASETLRHLGPIAQGLGRAGVEELWAVRESDRGFGYVFFFRNSGGASKEDIEEIAFRGTGRADWIVEPLADGWIHLGLRDRSRQVSIDPDVADALRAGRPSAVDDDLSILEARPFANLDVGNPRGNFLERRRATLAAAARPCLVVAVRHSAAYGPTRLDVIFRDENEAESFLQAIAAVSADLRSNARVDPDDFLEHILFVPLTDGTPPVRQGNSVQVPLRADHRADWGRYHSRDWVSPYETRHGGFGGP